MLHELPQLLHRHLLAGRVDGREVRGRRDAVQIVRTHVELVPAQLAAQAYPRSGPKLVLQPGLVEPDRGDLVALVGHAGLNDCEPSRGTAQFHALHLAGDRGLLLGQQVCDPPLRDRSFIAVRCVLEQIPDLAQAELGELPFHDRPNAVQRVELLFEPLGSRRRTWPRPAFRTPESGEFRRFDRGQSAFEYRSG